MAAQQVLEDLVQADSAAEVAVRQEDGVDSEAVEAHPEAEAVALAEQEAVLVAVASAADVEEASPAVDEAADLAATEVAEAEDSAVEVAGAAATKHCRASVSSATPSTLTLISHVLCKSILSACFVRRQATNDAEQSL